MTLLKFLTLALFVISFSCDTTEPPPVHMPTVQLALDEASVTEVWLRLEFTDLGMPRGFAVQRDGLIVLTGILSSQDTIVVDTFALPKHNYLYAVLRTDGAARTDSSIKLNVTTLDTTSSQYTFFADTLGVGSSSILNDVNVISENDIWAVGELFQNDSLGQIDPTPYNVVHWNGIQWNLMRIPFPICDYLGNEVGSYPFEVVAIFSSSATEAWLSAASTIVHRNGQLFQRMCVTEGYGQRSFKSMWDEGSKVYIVGTNGSITELENGQFRSIPTSTTLPINDVWGGVDQRSGEQVILAVASNTGVNQGMKLLRIQGALTSELATDGLAWKLSSLWFKPNRRYYVVGDGLYEKSSLSSSVR